MKVSIIQKPAETSDGKTTIAFARGQHMVGYSHLVLSCGRLFCWL